MIFALGSNTYYAKSMQGKLLAAKRLQSLFEGETSEREVITLIINEKSVRIDCRQHRVWIEDQEVELTAREVFLLERLAQQPNEIVSLVQLVKTTQ